MFLSSPMDPTRRTAQEVIVFCHNDERIITTLPTEYEKAELFSREQFGLSGPIHLVTEDLPAPLNGTRVRIHQDAWRVISPIVYQVIIEVTGDTGSKRKSSARKSSIASKRTSEAQPAAALLTSTDDEEDLEATQSDDPTDLHPPRLKSPTKTNRSRVMSDDEEEDEEGEEEEERVEEEEEGKEQDEVDLALRSSRGSSHYTQSQRSSYVSAQFSSVKDQLEEIEITPRAKTVKDPSPSTLPFKPSPASDPADFQSPPETQTQEAESDYPLQATSSKSKSKPESKKGRLSLHDQSLVNKDETFLITIQHIRGDRTEDSIFKTRGRHLVGKVLKMACKTFNIGSEIGRARLILIEEDEEGEEHRFPCENEDSMLNAGAYPDATFIIDIP